MEVEIHTQASVVVRMGRASSNCGKNRHNFPITCETKERDNATNEFYCATFLVTADKTGTRTTHGLSL